MSEDAYMRIVRTYVTAAQHRLRITRKARILSYVVSNLILIYYLCHNSVVDKATDSGKAPAERKTSLHSCNFHSMTTLTVSATTLQLCYIRPHALEEPSIKAVSFLFA